MPDYVIRVPRGARLSAALSEMPKEVRLALKQGFSAVDKMSPEALDKLIAVAREAAQGPEAIRDIDLKNLGIDEMDTAAAAAAVGAAALVVSLVADDEAQITAAISTLTTVLEQPVTSPIKALVDRLNAKELRTQNEKTRLARAILPSFRTLETTVDVRIDFEKGSSNPLIVPVAVAFLDTDAVHQRLWFQLTGDQIEGLIKQLEELRENLKRAAGLRFP
jgi:hypothetical protein